MGDFEVYEKDGWVFADNVPVFDENERDGIVYDEEVLTKTVSNNNARIKDTGDLSPVVIGHKPDDAPETESEVIGWASNFKIGDWGKVSPRKCIFADLKFTKENWEKAKNFPRRSVEIWTPDTDEVFIDPIALLAATTPQRDLGLLFSKNLNEKCKYHYQFKGDTVDKEEMMKLVNECMENSDVHKWAKAKMEEEGKDKAPDEDAPKPDDDKVENESDEDEKETDADEDDKEKLKNQRDAERRKFARLATEHAELNSRLADLERKERKSARKADLLGLEAEGVNFDFAEELETVADQDAKTYARHLDTMRKRYARSPIGVKLPVRDVPAHGLEHKTEMSRDDVQRAFSLIQSGKAKTHEEALNLIKGGM